MLYNWGQGLILVALKIDIWTSAYVGMLTFGGNVNFFTQRLHATATNNVSRCQIDLMDHKIESIDVSNSLCCSIVFGQSHNNWVFQRERLRTTYSLKKPEITSQGRICSSQEFYVKPSFAIMRPHRKRIIVCLIFWLYWTWLRLSSKPLNVTFRLEFFVWVHYMIMCEKMTIGCFFHKWLLIWYTVTRWGGRMSLRYPTNLAGTLGLPNKLKGLWQDHLKRKRDT